MTNESFICKCVSDTLEGLREGLSHFSGASRAAVIFALSPDDPIYLFDSQNLLQGHEPRFKELYLDSDSWRKKIPTARGRQKFGHVHPEPNLDLAGLISYGGRSNSVFYQMWFTEHHPAMCSIGPTECWLEHAAWRLSHDIANEEELYTGISGSFLREYATNAVRDWVVDQMNRTLGWDTRLRIFPILDAVLGISRTREEGAWARGDLVFVQPSAISKMAFVAKFPETEQPSLENYKHVRKLLLAVENSDRKLVSDGTNILGIANGEMPDFCIIADFKGGHGFIRLNTGVVCSFSDGSFKSSTRRAKLVQVEEALLEMDIDPEKGSSLFRIIAEIVHSAETRKHGCTLAIDLNEKPLEISGQKLDHPIELNHPQFVSLAKSLAKVDGALHIGRDLHLHGFACLLDGLSIPGEDRARGARFNSALRFSAQHPNVMVVVVSSDRPVSVILEGVELNAQCRWNPVSTCVLMPPTLDDWVARQNG